MDLSAAMSQATDPMRLMQRVTDRTLELISTANGVMIGIADHEGVTYVCGAGNTGSRVGTRVNLDSSLTGLAVRTGQIMRSDDTASDPRVDAEACRQLSVASLVCVPLSRAQETLGVMAVNAARPHAFTDDDVATLRRLSDFVSVAIGSARDLSRMSAALLELDESADESVHGSASATSVGSATRYVMSVLSPETVTRVESSQRIQQVLDDPDVLSMVFQPIVDLRSDEVAAVEALARFAVTPSRTPDLWFDEAHQVGMGVELEMLAIRHALAHLRALPDRVALTINAGPEVVMSPQFTDTLRDIPVRRVALELTEHTAVDDYPALIASLRALRRRGLRIAVDDTGSGYSSLAHILKLAPDFIKLDRDLVSGIDLDPVRRALAASLVAFAAETGAQIIAEGVENEDELEVVRRLDIRYAQGYHLRRPANLDAAISSTHLQPATRSVARNPG
jgi:EAL domain-containing protein (putative c-di-GMP-specific phosphodiesterase class I)